MNKPAFVNADPDFESRVRSSFSRQHLMTLFGATMDRVEPGRVDISLLYRSDLTQQNSYLHAAVTSAIADSACGYAALTLTPRDSDVLTVEFKVNLLRPAVGTKFVAEGQVLKPGKTITVAQASVFAIHESDSKLVSILTATIMRLDGVGSDGPVVRM